MSDILEDTGSVAKPAPVVIPYKQRKHFVPFHASQRRWQLVVAHRRAGKSVAFANHLIRAAIQNPRAEPPPRYAYIGPSFAQAKDLIWGYMKHYTAPIPGMQFSESELSVIFPNRGRINLYGGSSAYERMRGLYFDGAVLDEFPLLNPLAFTQVVRPALADYRGFGIVGGTSNGQDHFYDLHRKALVDEEWDVHNIGVYDTDALHPDEVAEMKAMMPPDQFAREMLNSFDAPVEGAYFGEMMNDAEEQGRITTVPWDPRAQVITCWDLGISDLTAIWFWQRIGREYHIIDYLEGHGKGLEHYVKLLSAKPYKYQTHIFPPDIEARELGTGRSRKDVVEGLGLDVTKCPEHRIEDRIQATRTILPVAWFDKERTAPGVAALRAYRAQKVPHLGTFKDRPLHNWASHGASAFGHGSLGIDLVHGWSGSGVPLIRGAIRRGLKGLA